MGCPLESPDGADSPLVETCGYFRFLVSAPLSKQFDVLNVSLALGPSEKGFHDVSSVYSWKFGNLSLVTRTQTSNATDYSASFQWFHRCFAVLITHVRLSSPLNTLPGPQWLLLFASATGVAWAPRATGVTGSGWKRGVGRKIWGHIENLGMG